MPNDVDAASPGTPPYVPLPADVLGKWQLIVNTMAEVMNVPAGLIMRLSGDRIEVCLSSATRGNPYVVGEAEHFEGSGLYCERVIESGRLLIVPDALADAAWRENPDVPRHMIAYLGFPIRWPDLSPFGTICVLDNKANRFGIVYERLVEQFRDVIEHHLELIARDSLIDLGRAELAAALQCSEQRLREAQSELTRLQRQSTLGQFAGAVFHEMNQPLAAIQSSIAAARRWLDRPVPDVQSAQGALDRLDDASRRAMEVIAGLRSMAKNTVVDPVVLDLHAVVREVVLMAHDDMAHARVDVRLHLSDQARHVSGDRPQLHLVLHNLIRNAIEAMSEVRHRQRVLTLSTNVAGPGQVAIVVEDTGVGLDAATAEQVFQPSFTTKISGMGLGLTICRAVIEAHRGAISASPRTEEPGARFTFTLPAAAAPTPPGR
jgi:signal transduction histidine kinase